MRIVAANRAVFRCRDERRREHDGRVTGRRDREVAITL
jgi:hypothetical protein